MEPIKTALSPQEAWQPLPASEWNEANAKHLLRRACFTATPAAVKMALDSGLDATLNRIFQPSPPLETPPSLKRLIDDEGDDMRRIREASPQDRRRLRQERREKDRSAYNDFAIRWLTQTADPRYSAHEKFVMFLQDVFVVSAEKVKNTADLFAYQNMLRVGAFAEYPLLAKAVSHSPAMIRYLDLDQNRKGSPNENFARELMELFTLGEGNYTEKDIKESARAFTGYRLRGDKPFFDPRFHDDGVKTFFGQSGRWKGDDIIDLIFKQEAACRFLPGELCRYYLTTEESLPPEYLQNIGDYWKSEKFQTGRLVQRFFSSRLFFEKQFHGQVIKSPVQLYAGLLQDLDLSVAPFPRITLNLLRQMGQPFYMPPNVRGWVGGRFWINSSTLDARRQLVEYLFAHLDEDKLNADEQVELATARSKGPVRLWVTDEELAPLAKLKDSQIADGVIGMFLTSDPGPAFHDAVAKLLNALNPQVRMNRIRLITSTILQSPEYQLC